MHSHSTDHSPIPVFSLYYRCMISYHYKYQQQQQKSWSFPFFSFLHWFWIKCWVKTFWWASLTRVIERIRCQQWALGFLYRTITQYNPLLEYGRTGWSTSVPSIVVPMYPNLCSISLKMYYCVVDCLHCFNTSLARWLKSKGCWCGCFSVLICWTNARTCFCFVLYVLQTQGFIFVSYHVMYICVCVCVCVCVCMHGSEEPGFCGVLKYVLVCCGI